MRIKNILILLSVCLVSKIARAEISALTQTDDITWDAELFLPAVDSTRTDNPGLAGAYAGYIGDVLVLAGGANFPDALPKDGGIKKWHTDVYTHSDKEGWKVWHNAMPFPAAYGYSLPWHDGILLIGGCDAERCLDNVLYMTLDEKGCPVFEEKAAIGTALSNMDGGMIGGKLYLAGGITDMKNPCSSKTFLCYDPSTGKTTYPQTWDGESRAFNVCAVQSDGLDNCLYMFSGREFRQNEPWNILNDAWKYNPRLDTWSHIEGEFPVMAGTAISLGTNHIILMGGRHAEDPVCEDNMLRLFHTVTGTVINVPVEGINIPVTCTAIKRGNSIVIASGETAPGIRTPIILRGTLQSHIKHIGWLDNVVIVLYFLILAWMGWHFSRKQKNADDYMKGGGRIPWFIVGLSIFGTGLSAITFMSIPAKAYATDWSYLLFNAGIILVVPLIVGVFIPFFRKQNITTAYEYLELRFNALVRVVCSIAFIVYQIGRMGVVLLLPAIALNVVSGVDIFLCISLMGILALIYTYMGGIEAVAWTDAMQVVVLLGAAIAVVVSVCTSLPDGMSSVFNIAASDDKFNIGSLTFDLKQSTIWTVLIATVFTNITTYGTDQTIVQRYLTTTTEQQARKGVYTNAILCLPATLLFFFVGTCIYVFFKSHPAELSPSINDADAILPWYVSTHIPAGVMGLVIAGIFAAAMSTISASMNSAATAYVTDIHTKINPQTDVFKTAKGATIVIGLIGLGFALMMATWDIKSLWDEFSKILGILLGGLGGLFLLAFTSKKANSIGAIAGIVGCIAVQLTVMHYQAVNLLLYSAVGFISCYCIGWIVSIITGGNKKDINGLVINNKK